MRFTENRPLAWAVLVACALGSIVGLGGAGMARERNKALDVFYRGSGKAAATSSTIHSMDAYLDRAADCAQLMASEVQLHLGESADAQQMLDQVADLTDGDTIDARYAAYQQVKALSDKLYNAVYASDLSDADRVNFKAAYDDFWGCDKYILKDPYRQLAADFNSSMQGFPADAVCNLVGVDELTGFGS